IFDRVVVGVLANPAKEPLFTVAERIELMRACVADKLNVEVTSFDGLTVDFAKATGAIAIVRGLRVLSDFESEFLMTSFSNVFVSSSIIREVCRLGGDVDEAAPAVSVVAMKRKFGLEVADR